MRGFFGFGVGFVEILVLALVCRAINDSRDWGMMSEYSTSGSCCC